MAYLSSAPAAPLNRWIETLWTSDRAQGLAHAREWGLPTGRADLVVPLNRSHIVRYSSDSGTVTSSGPLHLAGGVLQGAMLQPVLRDTASASIVVGAHFRPCGLAGLFAWPADEVAGQVVPLDDLWPGFAEALQDQVARQRASMQPALRLQIFEQALLLRLRGTAGSGDLDLSHWAWQQLAAGLAVREVQRASGWSHASFVRRYRAATGLLPKQHAGVMRFQAALRLGQAGQAWADVAAQAGYADQAHLSRHFRQLAGMAPGQVRSQATEFSNHLRWR